jgi:hypothetical protein
MTRYAATRSRRAAGRVAAGPDVRFPLAVLAPVWWLRKHPAE